MKIIFVRGVEGRYEKLGYGLMQAKKKEEKFSERVQIGSECENCGTRVYKWIKQTKKRNTYKCVLCANVTTEARES
jgi:predicted metal-binding protein